MQPKTIVSVTSVVLLVALASLWFTLKSSTSSVNPNIHTCLGVVLAQEAAKAVSDRGEVVAVIADAYEQSGAVLCDQWQAFTGELKKHAWLNLAKPVVVPFGGRVSLRDVLDRHPQAKAIVFFASPPDWEEMSTLTDWPKVIMLGNPDLPAKAYYSLYFSSTTLAGLILSHTSQNRPVPPKTPREWFDRYYQLYTPQNFESLPE